MRALKGLFIYIGIVLVLILSAGAITLCIMYFAPNVRVFGVGCVHYRKTVNQEAIDLSSYSDISTIELNINSGDVDVSLLPTTDEGEIKSSLQLKVFGFATQITEYSVVRSLDFKDGVLKVVMFITEPNGWFPTSNSSISISIPNNFKYSLIVTSDKGNVSLGSSKANVEIENLSISTGSGNLDLINMGKGEDNSLNINSLNLSTNSGEFKFNDIDKLNVNSKIRLNANSGSFRFKDINGSLDIRGTDVSLYANVINTKSEGFKLLSDNGYFEIDTLSSPAGAENTIVTNSCSVNIKSLYGKSGIVSTYGDINIDSTNNYTVLESSTGNIKVKKANDVIRVNTSLGDISVDEYVKSAKFETNKGKITVYSSSEYSNGYVSEIISRDGDIFFKNKANKFLLTTTGKAKVRLELESIPSQSLGVEGVDSTIINVVKIGEQGSAEVFIPLVLNSFRYKTDGIVTGEICSIPVKSSHEYQYAPQDASEENYSKSATYEFYGKLHFLQSQTVI